MKKILITLLGILLIYSFFVITTIANSGDIGGYNTPEALQSRIDYNLKIIWELEQRYKTTDCRKMSQRDGYKYINAKQNLKQAIAEYNWLIKNRQYKQKGYYRQY